MSVKTSACESSSRYWPEGAPDFVGATCEHSKLRKESDSTVNKTGRPVIGATGTLVLVFPCISLESARSTCPHEVF